MNEILQGDAWQLAKSLPDNSVNCIVTSPPYFGLRDYGTAQWEGGDAECDHVAGMDNPRSSRPLGLFHGGDDKFHATPYRNICGKCGARRVDSQFGLENSPAEYVDKLVALFRELRRALRHDGTVWLNLAPSYNGSGGAGGDYSPGGLKDGQPRYPGRNLSNFKPKDMIPIPWMVAMALQADGWWLRQDIIWSKVAPMPESVTDRCTKSHEYVFLLTKSPRYFYDADAIREPNSTLSAQVHGRYEGKTESHKHTDEFNHKGKLHVNGHDREMNGRNKRSVWTLGPEPQKAAHFAVMPTKLVEPCILAGCPHRVCAECGNPHVRQVERELVKQPNGLGNGTITKDLQTHNRGKTSTFVTGMSNINKTTGFAPTCDCNGDTRPGVTLDPFLGSGTVAVVARRLGRDWLGFELSPEYVELAYDRIGGTQPALFEVT